MATRDVTDALRRGPIRPTIDTQGAYDAMSRGADQYDAALDDTAAGMQSVRRDVTTTQRGSDQFAPAEFALNDRTGEVALPNGEIIKANAPVIVQLATLQNEDGRPIPKMRSVPDGFRPISQQQLQAMVAATPLESDFWGQAKASTKATLGLIGSAMDSMIGNDDPNNEWSGAQRDRMNEQTLGQYKAGQGRWYSSFDSFLSSLGETGGNIAGNVIGAIPVAGAAAGGAAMTSGGVGAIPGGAMGLGLGVSGGAAAYGEQATDFYTAAMDAMKDMSPETLERESPLYRQILASNPGITQEEAIKEVAIQGARAAGTTAGALGAAEGMIGGRLAGNLLARMGVSKAILGAGAAPVIKAAGAGRTALRVGGRMAAGGAAAGAEEMAESMLGQAAGAAYTGIGDDDPMAHLDIEEGIQASLGGAIFGALGGRRSATPAEALESSGLGAALAGNDNIQAAADQTAWSRPNTIPEDVLNSPALGRRELGERTQAAATAMPAPDQRDQVLGQLDAVLQERFGPDWSNRTEEVARDPRGRQILGQIMGIQREIQSEQERPAYERRSDMREVPPGDPFAPAALRLDGNPPQANPAEAQANPAEAQAFDPNQQSLPGMEVGPQDRVASEPRQGETPLNLRERREAQRLRQEEMRQLSEQQPAALGVRDSRMTEQRIMEIEDEVAQLQEQLDSRAPRDPRKKYYRDALKQAKANLRAAEGQWEEQRLAEGPQGVVDAPEPVGASAERTPDGRPVGVAPAPLVNPEPMNPEEARQRSLTQQARRQRTTAATATEQARAPAQAASQEQLDAAVAQSEDGVAPSTPEPAQDVQAQIEALADPASGRDAVFVADGGAGAAGLGGKRGLPQGAQEVYRKGVGTLITTNPAKAAEFRTKKLTDAKMAQLLGYSTDKASALRRGEAPVVVQAKTPAGAVAAEQITDRAGVPAAKKAVKKLARKDAKVEVTTPEKAQAERAAPRSLKRGRETPSAPAKKSLKKPSKDDERTAGPSEAQIEAGNYKKRQQRVDGVEISVETEAGQRRRPEWPPLKNAYGYIKRSLAADGEQVDVFLGPKADQPGNVYVIDQNKANGHFDEHKVMLGFDSADAARRAYLSNYGRDWNGLGKVTAMEWGEFKQWIRDGKLTTERTRVESSNAETFSERAQRLNTEAAERAPSIADTISRGAQRKPDTVRAGGKTYSLPERLTERSGRKGINVDLTVEAPNEDARATLARVLASDSLSVTDNNKLEAALRDYEQLDTMLDASVKSAEERVLASDEMQALLEQEKARQLELENSTTAGSRGRPRETPRSSPLAYLPLSAAEQRGFLRTLRSEAKAELDGRVSPAQSVVRLMMSAFDPRYTNAMADERQFRQVLGTVAKLSDADLAEMGTSMGQNLYHSTVAKQVMRGATEVAHAMARMQRDLNGARTMQSWGDHLASDVDATKLPHVTEHGSIPEAARGLVNTWIAQFEKGGNKFSGPVHVVDMRDAVKNYPEAFLRGVPGGKFLRLTDDKGNTTSYVLAMDWGKYQTTEAAVEVLAHEYGHMVTMEMYARADPRTRSAIDKAYDSWLGRQWGRDLGDVLRDQMPGYERMMFKAAYPINFHGQPTYATNFWEWSARNAALYVLDPKRPHLSAVETFFSKVGSIMRKLYESLTGAPKTDATWAEAMDRWITGTMQISPMPQMPSSHFNHEEFAEGTKAAGDIDSVRENVRAQTSSLGALKGMLSGTPGAAQVEAAMRDVTKSGAMHNLKRLGLSLLTLRQIEQQYRDTPLGKPLSAWVRNQQLKAKQANTTMESGSRWMEQANALDAKVRTQLERMMYYSTHFGIHPDRAITDKSNAHLLVGNDRVKAVQEKRYNMVSDLYKALVKSDPRVATIYTGLRDAFGELNQRTLDKMVENIENAGFTAKVKEEMVKRIREAQGEQRQGPYFPMMRFGKWIVKAAMPSRQITKKDGSGWATKTEVRDELRNQRALNPGANITVEGEKGDYYIRVMQQGVYFFETEKQALDARAQIEAEVREHYDQHDVDFDRVAEGMADEDKTIISQPFNARDDYGETKQGSSEFLQEVRALLNEKKIDPEVAATFERLAIESLPENSYRHSLLPRQNIFGASKQMLRAYAHRFQGAAYNYATVEYAKAINDSWSKAWDANRVYSPAGRVLNTLQSNQQAVADRVKPSTGNTAMNVITDASSLFSLGFSPAYVMTNALQPMMITTPVLAGMVNPVTGNAVGMVKAAKYLAEAYKGAVPFFTKRGIHDFISETKALLGTRAETPTLEQTARGILDRFAKDDGERAMLESLLDRGTLDFSWLNSLEDAMRGGAAGQKWAALQRLAMAMPQQVEAMNRVASALASYRMAKAENLTDGSRSALQDFADEVVANTQLDYSRMNRPLAFNKAGLNVILQFKLYMQGMYMLFARQAANAMATVRNTPRREDETAAQHAERVAQLRSQGRRTVAYLLAMHGAVGGMTGLGPVSAASKLALVSFAMMTGDDDDKWKSGDQLQKELLADLFGDQAGLIADKGLPGLIGVDMSDRIGIPLLVDSRFMNVSERDNAATGMDKVLIFSLGAPYSNARRVVQGTSDLVHGDLRSAVNGLPASMRSIARSAKWASEGIVDKDGDTFVPRSELSWGNIAITGLGLSPLAVAEKYQDRSELRDTSAKILQRRVQLVRQHNAGEASSEDIADFNRSVPKPFRISAEQLSRSKKSKAERDRGETNKQDAALKKLLGQ